MLKFKKSDGSFVYINPLAINIIKESPSDRNNCLIWVTGWDNAIVVESYAEQVALVVKVARENANN